MRTVQKEGDNKGRDFYCCGKAREEQCRYFQWRDEVQAQGPAGGGGGGGGPAGGGEDGVNCNCGQVCAKRTVFKDGPNKGREFYCCSKPREEQCGYFQWSDELPAPGRAGAHWPPPAGGGGRGGGRGGGGGRGRGGAKRSQGQGEGEKKQRKCGLCHEPGHVRTRCPMRD